MSTCTGITRAGRTCQISAHSSMRDLNGRSIAGPLRHGSPFCMLHAKPFVHCAADLASVSGPIVLMFLDLETTGTDVSTCRIVEFACCSLSGANFSAVVKVPTEVLTEPTARAAAMVHGIQDSEILEGDLFPVVWGRFLEFVEHLSNNYIVDTDEDEDGASQGQAPSTLAWSPRSPALPRPPDKPPTILCVAHNGYTLVQETKTKTRMASALPNLVRCQSLGIDMTSQSRFSRSCAMASLSQPCGDSSSPTRWKCSQHPRTRSVHALNYNVWLDRSAQRLSCVRIGPADNQYVAPRN